MLHAYMNSVFLLWGRANDALELLRPKRRAGLVKTSDFYMGLMQVIGVVSMMGRCLEAIVQDVHQATDIHLVEGQFRGLRDNYDTFRQQYTDLTQRIQAYADETEQLFGREIQFVPPHLLALRTDPHLDTS